MKINHDEIKFASDSIVDENGRVFYWREEVFRAISPQSSSIYEKLLTNEKSKRLFEVGLIETEISSHKMDNYGLILRHRKIPITSYVTEWCGNMLKSAAILTLDINLALIEFGLELKDAHPWNVLFDGCDPNFIDFSSIVPIKDRNQWHPYREFIGMFYYPLSLMASGYTTEARSLLIDQKTHRGKRITKKELVKIIIKEKRIRKLLKIYPVLKALAFVPKKFGRTNVQMLTDLRKRISAIKIPIEKTSWSEYSLEEVNLNDVENWMTKRKTVHKIISQKNPKTLLDIGSNTGWFSKLAAMLGSRVISIDVDEACINKLYLNELANELKILPLVMDFKKPTPAYGIGQRCIPAIVRYSSEMVLGLAVVHHLVFKQHQKFAEIVEKLAAFTERWLVLEFIPKHDKYVKDWFDDTYEWYTVENLTAELSKYFSKVELYPSNPDPRIILLCER